MSTNATASDAAPKPAKSKKLLIIGAIVVLVLAIIAAGTLWFISQRHAEAEEGDEPVAKVSAPAAIPTFLPMETMVVNLADAGGERFAQIGITVELADTKTADLVKQYMPSIRSSILLLTSQRTSDELLTREGKEKLAADILREVSSPLGFQVPTATATARGEDEDAEDDGRARKKRLKQPVNPVQRIHFSGFIIQ